jgi:hypothetical protein
MSAASKAADRAEERAAKALGAVRQGGKMKRRPVADLAPFRTPDGTLITTEVKSRKRLPRLLVDALAQAQRYAPGAEPLAVLFERGQRSGLVVLSLDLFRRLTGISPPAAQLDLALSAPVKVAA